MARKAEAQLVRASRSNTLALVSVTSRCLRGALRRAQSLEERIATADDGKLSRLEEVTLLDQLARTMERASRAARETMAMERVLLGEPTEIIASPKDTDYSEDAVLAKIDEFVEAANRVRDRKKRREARLPYLKSGGDMSVLYGRARAETSGDE